MNYYLNKYVGTYRVKAEIDKRTNDFCRDEKGNLENNMDIWIKCTNGIKIFHYGGSTLQVYIPSINKGRNILRNIYRDFINKDNTDISVSTIIRDGKLINKEIISIIDKELYIKDLSNKNIIFDIEETDEEVIFKVMDKNLEKIIDKLKPQTSGASISPFSPKNLPQGRGDNKYKYTPTQIEAYEKITDVIPKENKLIIGRLNNEFLNQILTKKLRLGISEIKADMKKECLKLRDYIYAKGFEKEYLEYLEKNIKNNWG